MAGLLVSCFRSKKIGGRPMTEFETILPIIIMVVFLLVFITFVIGIVVMSKRKTVEQKGNKEININLEKRVETLEKEIKNIKVR